MTKEAEMYEQEDKEFREFTEAKNGLEAQLFQMKSSFGDQDGAEEGKKIIDEFLSRVAECNCKDDVDSLQKEFMEKAQELAQQAGKAGVSAEPDVSCSPDVECGPTIEEVD